MFCVVVISFNLCRFDLLVRLYFRYEKVIIEYIAVFPLFAILDDDVHRLFFYTLEESSAAFAHFGWLTWHCALHSGLSGPHGWLVKVAETLVVPIDVIESAIVI